MDRKDTCTQYSPCNNDPSKGVKSNSVNNNSLLVESDSSIECAKKGTPDFENHTKKTSKALKQTAFKKEEGAEVQSFGFQDHYFPADSRPSLMKPHQSEAVDSSMIQLMTPLPHRQPVMKRNTFGLHQKPSEFESFRLSPFLRPDYGALQNNEKTNQNFYPTPPTFVPSANGQNIRK